MEYARRAHDTVQQATSLGYAIGKTLEQSTATSGAGRLQDKIKVQFVGEMRKLQQLGRELGQLEKNIKDVHVGASNEKQQQEQQEVQIQMEDDQLERREALRIVAKDVHVLNEMMVDLAGLVEEQDEIVTHLSSSVQSTRVHVEKGELELLQASEYQKRKRSRAVCLLLVLLSCLLFMLFVVYLFSS
jgi:hypothetical protein